MSRPQNLLFFTPTHLVAMATTSKASPPVVIDHLGFPHIMDAIMDALMEQASTRDLLTLRSVSRSFGHQIDSHLFKHVVVEAVGGHPAKPRWTVRTRDSTTLVLHEDLHRRLHAFIQVLDVQSAADMYRAAVADKGGVQVIRVQNILPTFYYIMACHTLVVSGESRQSTFTESDRPTQQKEMGQTRRKIVLHWEYLDYPVYLELLCMRNMLNDVDWVLMLSHWQQPRHSRHESGLRGLEFAVSIARILTTRYGHRDTFTFVDLAHVDPTWLSFTKATSNEAQLGELIAARVPGPPLVPEDRIKFMSGEQ
ncbi:uncharacterized protein EHS24_001693 [Apiotrichum porosum]|uniref:Uncharacterized protein n=1 Tax=Apiotrichum porosum TaxID=105984 RepID=A0A427XIQ8_9TREE|nr:uncharacterized protein EHS24_001693 [Apiotrichum porosum]RSH78785.1 hypothetical protein EHS24_001693 [Apiotrichum porosum]